MNKNKNKKEILLPAKPNADKLIAAGILIATKPLEFSPKVQIFHIPADEKWNVSIQNAFPLGLDIGEAGYEKIGWKTYTEFMISEQSIEITPKIQQLIEVAKRTGKGSFVDFVNIWYTAGYRYQQEFSETEITQEGVKIVQLYLIHSIVREDEWASKLLKEEIQSRGIDKIPRLSEYLESGETMELDLLHILSLKKQVEGEEKAKELAGKIIEAYRLASKVFNEARKEVEKKAVSSRVRRVKIIAVRSDNPLVMLLMRGDIKIQQLRTAGHIQIVISENVPIEVSDTLIVLIRMEEMRRRGDNNISAVKNLKGILKERRCNLVPEWFYVKPPSGPRSILNGSSRTTEEIPPTRIPLRDIVKLGEDAVLYS